MNLFNLFILILVCILPACDNVNFLSSRVKKSRKSTGKIINESPMKRKFPGLPEDPESFQLQQNPRIPDFPAKPVPGKYPSNIPEIPLIPIKPQAPRIMNVPKLPRIPQAIQPPSIPKLPDPPEPIELDKNKAAPEK